MELSAKLCSLLIILVLFTVSFVTQASAKPNLPSFASTPLHPVIGKPPTTTTPAIGESKLTIPVITPPVITLPVITPPVLTLPPVVTPILHTVSGKPPLTIGQSAIDIPVITIPVITPPVITPPVLTLPPIVTPIIPAVTTTQATKPRLTKHKYRPGRKPAIKKCPVAKLGACLDLIGAGAIHSGDATMGCCPQLDGLLDGEAALCLCTAIKRKQLRVNRYLPIAHELLATCGKKPPPGYKC